MTKNPSDNDLKDSKLEMLDQDCEECNKKDESVNENLVLTGFKICKSCRVSKTVFPIQLTVLIGKASIRLITNDNDKNANIKKDKKTIPKDLKFDFNPKMCFVDIIRDANIQNCVRNIIVMTKSGVTAKNLIRPGE